MTLGWVVVGALEKILRLYIKCDFKGDVITYSVLNMIQISQLFIEIIEMFSKLIQAKPCKPTS